MIVSFTVIETYAIVTIPKLGSDIFPSKENPYSIKIFKALSSTRVQNKVRRF